MQQQPATWISIECGLPECTVSLVLLSVCEIFGELVCQAMGIHTERETIEAIQLFIMNQFSKLSISIYLSRCGSCGTSFSLPIPTNVRHDHNLRENEMWMANHSNFHFHRVQIKWKFQLKTATYFNLKIYNKSRLQIAASNLRQVRHFVCVSVCVHMCV